MYRVQRDKMRKRDKKNSEKRVRFLYSGRMMKICTQWTLSWNVGLFLYFHSLKTALNRSQSGLLILSNKYRDIL